MVDTADVEPEVVGKTEAAAGFAEEVELDNLADYTEIDVGNSWWPELAAVSTWRAAAVAWPGACKICQR